MGFRHNKKRNAALLYEFLVRSMANSLLENNTKKALLAADITKKYFSKGSLLHEELQLFNNVLKTKVSSRHSAQKIVDGVCGAAKQMNVRKLDVEKSKLIKEINHGLDGKQFYNCKIPNYTVYASVQTLLNESRNKKNLVSSIERVKVEDTIIEHLVNDKHQSLSVLKTNPNYNNVVYRFVIERFHKKYEHVLSENQKKLLSKYVIFMLSGNDSVLRSALQKEVKTIKESLQTIKDKKVLSDKDLMQKLKECREKFDSMDFEQITEDTILGVLQYMQLVDEVKS